MCAYLSVRETPERRPSQLQEKNWRIGDCVAFWDKNETPSNIISIFFASSFLKEVKEDDSFDMTTNYILKQRINRV